MANFTGTTSNDTLNGGVADDILDGLAGNDFLWGNDGNDSATGGDGNDSLEGGAGADTLDGGNGNDFVYFANQTSAGALPVKQGAVVNLATGVATDPWGHSDVLKNIENVYGSPQGDAITLASVVGSSARGGGGNDLIKASAEGATFYGGAGNDTLDGGAGFLASSGANADVANYSDEYDNSGAVLTGKGVNVNLITGVATDNWGNTDTLIGIEFVTGSKFADVLTGGNAANGTGGTGGFEGFDGQAGDDTIDGGVGFDRAAYTGASTGIVAVLTNGSGTVQDGYGNTDTLLSIEEIRASAFADKLTGSSTSLYESFEGRAGNDTLDGGAGGGGINRISFQTSPAAVKVDLGKGTASDGWGGTDTIKNFDQIRGSAFNDTLTGSTATLEGFEGREGDDLIDGVGGYDYVQYTASPAAINGTLNNGKGTVLDGTGGTDTLLNIDQINASPFNDTLTGSNTSLLEVFQGWGGNDTIDGGGGSGGDRVTYWDSPSGVVVNLALGAASDGWGGADVLRNINGVIGSFYVDLLTGDGGANVMQGLGGNDTMDGAGNFVSSIFGVNGGPNVSSQFDVLAFFDSTAAVTVAFGATAVNGKATGAAIGTDVISNFEMIVGSPFGDVISGSDRQGSEIFRGGLGDDTITGGSGAGVDLGFDAVDYRDATAAVNVNLATGKATGAMGNDVISGIRGILGGSANDILTGDAGDNLVAGNGGNDTLDGGAGLDRADYSAATAGVTVNLASGTATGGAGSDTLISFESVRGSAFADTLFGSDVANDIAPREGNDTVSAAGGDDTIWGSAGSDSIDGGAGTDTVAYEEPIDRFTISRSGNTTTVAKIGTSEIDTLVNVERITFADASFDLVFGSTGADTISGTSGNDAVYGGDGNDDLSTNDGDDLLDGGAGADRMAGGRGNDIYIVDDAGDVVVEVDNAAAAGANDPGDLAALDLGGNVDRVVASVDYTLGNFVENLDLRGGNLKGTGNALANTVVGSDGNNQILALEGNDRLDGGKGNDTLDGGVGIDTAVFGGARGAYTISVSATTSLSVATSTGTDGSDTLNGIERLEFADGKLAFDLADNAGSAAMLVGALLGKGGLKNTGAVGAVLGLLDGGQTVADLCALAVNAGVVASLAGGAGNDKLAALVVKNLTGAADAGLVGVVQGLLDSGAFTPASLLTVAATTDLNKTSVDLVGLAQSGLTYG